MNIVSKEIIQEWGLGNLSEIKQVEMVERIGLLIYQAVLVQSLDILSDAEQTELDTLMGEDSTTTEDVLAFLNSKIPTFKELVKEEQDRLKESILVASE